MPASAAVSATFRSSAPAPAVTSSSFGTMSAKPRPKPDHHARGCRRRAPAGWSRRRSPSPECRPACARENRARSSASAGRNSTSAGPPTRNQVSGADRRIRRSAGRAPSAGDRQQCALPHAHAAIMRPLRSRRGRARRQRVGPVGDRAGAEADDDVAGPGQIAQHRARDRCGLGQRHARCGGRARSGRRPAHRGRCPWIGASPAGVDIGDQHRVGVVEAGAEPVEQIGEPGIAVRLHDGDDLARRRSRAPPSAPRRSRPGGGRNRR